MVKKIEYKIILLLTLIAILLAILLIKDNNKKQEQLNTTEITEEITEDETVVVEEEKKEEPVIIIEEFINYKYLPRLLRLGINSMMFTEKFFEIERIESPIDYDNDGIDDYEDIYEGAMNYVKTDPLYFSDYYEGGYPPDDIGVCTDVVWNALKNAGYILKDMVDEDIAKNKKLYPAVGKNPDPNIDFRRVRNLRIFFSRYYESLTLDINDIEQWQLGDIITFGDTHIGIISKYRNIYGVPYVIHHGGKTPAGQYNILTKKSNISGHFRIPNGKEIIITE